MEVVTAITILGLIASSVLVVLNRSMEAVIDGRVRMQAFELARRNMEELLASDSVTDMAEFGAHELNEDLEWETVVEPFDEPLKSKMWIRAMCSASFTDRHGERQRIELTHWLTPLSGTQRNQILDQRRRQQEFLEQAQGNPFGNDPDGLMQYGRALASMGDYAKAAAAFSRVPLQYPDSEMAGLALKQIPSIIEALAMTDPAAANDIVPQLVELFPDEPDIQSLPEQLPEWTSDSFMPISTDPTGQMPPGSTDPETTVPPGAAQDGKPPGPGKIPAPDRLKDLPPELEELLKQKR